MYGDDFPMISQRNQENGIERRNEHDRRVDELCPQTSFSTGLSHPASDCSSSISCSEPWPNGRSPHSLHGGKVTTLFLFQMLSDALDVDVLDP